MRTRRTLAHACVLAVVLGATLLLPADGGAQPAAPPKLGVIVPDAARAVLTQAELVEAVCLTTKWRAEELYAAVDGVAAKQPAAQAALDKAQVKYTLPNHEEFRKRANDTLAAICTAPTVDRAVALTSNLLQINTDMEAKYGALSEALGGPIKESVDRIEARIRADINAFVEPRRQKAEADLRAEGQAIADRFRAPVEERYRQQINAYATNLAKGYKPEQAAAFQSALQPYIDQKIAEAKAEVTALVEAEMAKRIEASKAQITEEANKVAQSTAALNEANLRALGAAFDDMLIEVERRVLAARGADSPARRAAVEIRVRLAMKTTDIYLADAKQTISLARAELAALKAANPAAMSADELLARLDASRAKLEADLRAAASAGDEVAFNGAYMGFEVSWREVAASVDRAAGTWTPARVCQEAGSALAAAKTEAEAARGQVQASQAALGGAAGADEEDRQRIQSLKDAFGRSVTTLDQFIANVAAAQAACQSPSGDPRTLISQLDQARLAQGVARQAYESARLLATSLAR